jgi:hypothetical protein
MHRFSGNFALLAFAAVIARAEQSQGLRAANKRYLRSSEQSKYNNVNVNFDEYEKSEVYYSRTLGKAGKGASIECVKWETSYVTELKPQYYYWSPYSSSSAQSSSEASASEPQYSYTPTYYYSKSGKGGKGRKLGKSDKIMVKYVEVQKEVKTCVETKSDNIFVVSVGDAGKSGKGLKGKSSKSQSLIANLVSSTEEDTSENISEGTNDTTNEPATSTTTIQVSLSPFTIQS